MADDTSDAAHNRRATDQQPLIKRMMVPLLALIIGVLASIAVTQVPMLREAVGLVPVASVTQTEEEIEFGVFTEFEGIVVNPKGTNGTRYLMIRLGIEAEKQKTLDRLTEIKPVAVDAVIQVLGEMTVAELSDIERRDGLKTIVKARLNQLLGDDGTVTRIYFTQYVLQ